MRIAIVGAQGQLGQDLCDQLTGDLLPLARPQLDLTRPESLASLTSLRPDVVINCAAYNFVDRAETEPEAAFAVNAFGVRNLAQACRDLGCVLVHFSTDYVFGLDAGRVTPYDETDAPGPLSVYGCGKLAGELFARSLCPRHFVVRTCGLYGRQGQGGKGGNFVETMLRKAREGAALRVVDDQRCTPTATRDLAQAVAALLRTEAYGLYHVTNAGSCTWHEFARTIFDLTGVPASLAPISSAQFGAKAQRPPYSVLDCSGFERQTGHRLRPWQEALRDYLATWPA